MPDIVKDTHCAAQGINAASQHSQDAANAIVSYRELLFLNLFFGEVGCTSSMQKFWARDELGGTAVTMLDV